ncbi:MAG: hypothetical protein M1816_004812, partial [Peltula sp. TS41687]
DRRTRSEAGLDDVQGPNGPSGRATKKPRESGPRGGRAKLPIARALVRERSKKLSNIQIPSNVTISLTTLPEWTPRPEEEL